jgi:hypothetical protein
MSDSTRPFAIEQDVGSVPQTDAWSFEASDQVIPRLSPTTVEQISERSAANRVISATDSFETIDGSLFGPATPRRVSSGLRAFKPLYQWEGVVQEVNGKGFSARLLPIEDGRAHKGQVEFADFDFDDLADESDLHFVQEGAIFYWTLGRSRSRAGQITKTSLVRFRRLPPASEYEALSAAREAEELLADLEDTGSAREDSSSI